MKFAWSSNSWRLVASVFPGEDFSAPVAVPWHLTSQIISPFPAWIRGLSAFVFSDRLISVSHSGDQVTHHANSDLGLLAS
jgi:hypothetical protein